MRLTQPGKTNMLYQVILKLRLQLWKHANGKKKPRSKNKLSVAKMLRRRVKQLMKQSAGARRWQPQKAFASATMSMF